MAQLGARLASGYDGAYRLCLGFWALPSPPELPPEIHVLTDEAEERLEGPYGVHPTLSLSMLVHIRLMSLPGGPP